MKKYILKTELQTRTELMLTIPAGTPADAVRLAGTAIPEKGEQISGALYANDEILNASFAFERKFEFDESMIIGTSENAADAAADEEMEKAARFLTANGYRYQGEEKDFLSDARPLFVKPIWTKTGREATAIFTSQKVLISESRETAFTSKPFFIRTDSFRRAWKTPRPTPSNLRTSSVISRLTSCQPRSNFTRRNSRN